MDFSLEELDIIADSLLTQVIKLKDEYDFYKDSDRLIKYADDILKRLDDLKKLSNKVAAIRGCLRD